MGKLFDLLKEQHGGDLDFKDGQVYYLFLNDGLFHVYLDDETKTLKIEVDFLPQGNTFVYSADAQLEELIDPTT